MGTENKKPNGGGNDQSRNANIKPNEEEEEMSLKNMANTSKLEKKRNDCRLIYAPIRPGIQKRWARQAGHSAVTLAGDKPWPATTSCFSFIGINPCFKSKYIK
jgi:hypothetical protein